MVVAEEAAEVMCRATIPGTPQPLEEMEDGIELLEAPREVQELPVPLERQEICLAEVVEAEVAEPAILPVLGLEEMVAGQEGAAVVVEEPLPLVMEEMAAAEQMALSTF